MEFEILPINNPERMFEFKYATKRKLFILRPSRGKGNHSDLGTPCQKPHDNNTKYGRNVSV